jgi:D-sedoheptulose 7-phosphate isomerase
MRTNANLKIEELIKRYPELNPCYNDIVLATELLIKMYKNGGKLLVCGNGGSASDSLHIVGELMKSFKLKRPISNELREKIADDTISDALEMGLPAISLVSEVALTTAYSNDQVPSNVFAQGVLGYGKKGDCLLAISTSGNSLNCVSAVKVANALGLKTISLTGKKDSKLSMISDITIKASATETFKIQELHLPIYHAICLALEEEFFGE